ncbi:hypothetical protein NA63_0238 [Flavobacteriaceae bacterium MAR_2010_105]|nr:hypothetical protein NA63_0238 [Flavobacteriaceae bacterium MAR_2010_105]
MKIFRTIGHRLLNKGKTVKHLKYVFGLDHRQVQDIIYQLALNKDAAKWLPQINHYHVLSKKVIDLLLTKNESLLKSIESQIH